MDTGEMNRAAHAPIAPVFERFSNSDIRALIGAYPLAWVCAGSGAGIEASQLPLVGVYDEAGRLTELIGHMARSNPLYSVAQRDPGATILFSGPDAYVSPEHAARRDWAPTWNYAQLRIEADIVFEPDRIDAALELLVEAMESGRADPWKSSELGGRYFDMRRAIIAFRAEVTRLEGTFKLGQDETADTLDAIVSNHPDPAMVRWMRRLNRRRL